MKHLLPDVSQAELVSILKLRLRSADDCVELLQDADVEAVLESSDAKKVADIREDLKLQLSEDESFRKAVRQYSSRHGPAGQSAGASSAAGAFRKNQYPKKIPKPPEKEWNSKIVEKLLPPTAHILEDNNNQRWLVSMGSEFRRSRSWGLYGFRESSLLCAQLAWKHWESLGGQACPIADLMSFRP